MRVLICVLVTAAMFGLAGCGGGPSGPVVPETVANGLAAAENGARWYRAGCYLRALSAYRAAHRYLASADHRSGVALTMNSLGAVYRALGDPQTARVFFIDAADVYQTLDDRIGWRQATVNHAAALIDAGDIKAALSMLDTVDAAGMPPFAPALTNRGIALMHSGRLADAESVLIRAIALVKSDASPAAATAHATMGQLLMRTEQLDRAKSHLMTAFRLDKSAQFHIGMADDLEFLADLALVQQNAVAAVDYLKRSYALNALMHRPVATDRTLVKLNVAATKAGMDIVAVVGMVSGWAADPAFEGPCDRP